MLLYMPIKPWEGFKYPIIGKSVMRFLEEMSHAIIVCSKTLSDGETIKRREF